MKVKEILRLIKAKVSEDARQKLYIVTIRLISVVLNIGFQLFAAAFFSKKTFGVYAIGKSLFQGFDLSHLGARYTLDRLLPGASRHAGIILFIQCQAVVLFVSVVTVMLWILTGYTQVLYLAFMVSGVAYALSNLIKTYFRGKGDYLEYLKASVYLDVVTLLLAFLAAVFWGLEGFVLLFTLCNVVVCFMYYRRIIPVSLLFLTWKRLVDGSKSMVATGFLLYCNALLLYFVNSADRMVVEKFYGVEVVADYSFIGIFFSMMIIVPSTFIELQMRSLVLNTSVKYYLKFTAICMAIVAACVTVAYFLLPFLLSFVSKYDGLLHELRIMLYATGFFACAQITSFYFHATDQRRLIIVSNLIASTIYIIGLYYFCYQQFKLSALIWNKVIYTGIFLSLLLLAPITKRVIKGKNRAS